MRQTPTVQPVTRPSGADPFGSLRWQTFSPTIPPRMPPATLSNGAQEQTGIAEQNPVLLLGTSGSFRRMLFQYSCHVLTTSYCRAGQSTSAPNPSSCPILATAMGTWIPCQRGTTSIIGGFHAQCITSHIVFVESVHFEDCATVEVWFTLVLWTPFGGLASLPRWSQRSDGGHKAPSESMGVLASWVSGGCPRSPIAGSNGDGQPGCCSPQSPACPQ